MHALAPALEKVPHGHAVALAAPPVGEKQNEPAVHGRQVDAPLEIWNVPGGHAVQLLSAAAALNVPATHDEQTLAPSHAN